MTKSKFSSKYELKMVADQREWHLIKRKKELELLLSDFIADATLKQKGLCDKCTMPMTDNNIEQSDIGPYVHVMCPSKRRGNRGLLSYLKGHGLA